ncbi:sugar phosphate isomerase/epimerase family protein [Catalinimonas niigatensis]|uniref:sugar phosphate isomerase/epimerase family protein n=1 Tax=Catalinimonas niigatensis TaxID=1397264 RepID=UPI0026667632|nr:sugar phosphate isomerase/epimerase family protein [Catalinimonas niigatensis]WPP50783.1 sugar phosphate isomerase/epimerase family protein [Catalinimonas niigatensis]
MQFGVSTFLWTSPFTTDSFDLVYKIKEMGFDIIEVPVEKKDFVDWTKLKEVVKDCGLKVTISGAFGADRDISSENPAIRKQGLDYIIDCIKIAAEMGSPIFGGPVYSAVGKTRFISEEQKKKERTWCVENLRKAAKVAEDYGIVVGVEPLNRFESDMVNTADQALSLVQAVDSSNVKIALDTFHCNIEEKDIPTTIRKIGKDMLCHVQGNESDRGTPGTGNLDWIGIREALYDIDYQGAVVIETFGAVSEEIAKATCIWRPLANSSDELAQEGLAFYKKLFAS